MRPEYREKDVSVRCTAVLPRHCADELKAMVEKSVIPSVSQGIRAAVECFVSEHKQHLYEMEMKKAANDKAFMKRTAETQEMFSVSDAENDVAW
ncbi:MAG: ribbon-helix-helix domain-containing protein [Synergistaceae bacterium]|jgi:metal-responsive CopG/Arc/MetJ family transcriptional regulator|nr:ribbon-helix-helix domain-containing protein [Synergistaceae bacterium]